MDEQHNNRPMSSAMQATAGTPPLDAKGAARRRFTRLGAGATGVILTLHSQPGMAADTPRCVSPSGFMSMTTTGTSRSPQGNCTANRSHGFWKNHPDAWESSAGISHAAKFGEIFPALGKHEGLAAVTLMDVLSPSRAVKDIDHDNVAMQTVTAYLNARHANRAGAATVLPESLVREIWGQFVRQGYYSPSSGAFIWNGTQIAEYLESTFR